MANSKALIYQIGKSEVVNGSRTDNTMAKRKGTREQTTIYNKLNGKIA